MIQYFLLKIKEFYDFILAMEQHDKILFDIKSENFSNGLPEYDSPVI